jgi:hypothetical protein
MIPPREFYLVGESVGRKQREKDGVSERAANVEK